MFSIKNTFKLGMVAFAVALVTGCASTASRTADIAGFTTEKMCYIAKESYQKVKNTSHILSPSEIRRNANAQKIINSYNRLLPVAKKFNEHNNNIPMEWELIIIKKDTANAWAMPCGKLAFYTGIVDKLDLNETEIASIMGHEMAHALLEHSKQKRGAGILLTIPALAASMTGAGQFAMGAITTTASVGGELPFSRTAELEADVIGAFLMAQAGYDPRGAISAEKKLTSYGGADLTPFLSTHPMGGQRIEALNRIMSEALLVYQGQKNIYTQMPDLKKLMKNKNHGHAH